MLGLFLTLGAAAVAALVLAFFERANVVAWLFSCVC